MKPGLWDTDWWFRIGCDQGDGAWGILNPCLKLRCNSYACGEPLMRWYKRSRSMEVTGERLLHNMHLHVVVSVHALHVLGHAIYCSVLICIVPAWWDPVGPYMVFEGFVKGVVKPWSHLPLLSYIGQGQQRKKSVSRWCDDIMFRLSSAYLKSYLSAASAGHPWMVSQLNKLLPGCPSCCMAAS